MSILTELASDRPVVPRHHLSIPQPGQDGEEKLMEISAIVGIGLVLWVGQWILWLAL